jgi:hypothetical protein
MFSAYDMRALELQAEIMSAECGTGSEPATIGSLRDALMSQYGYAPAPRLDMQRRGPNMIDRSQFAARHEPLPQIPNLEEIHIPSDMPERLKKDVWRCLKTLKREYEDQSKDDSSVTLPEDYARMGSWDQKKKQDRRRMQNRKAARRFRVKNLEVVWAMVTSYQKCKSENDALRQQIQQLGGSVPPSVAGDVPPSVNGIPPIASGDARIKQEPVTPGPSFQDPATIKLPIKPTEPTITPSQIVQVPPPLPPISGKKRKLENGRELVMPAGASWIVQKNAVDLIQKDLLTLTVVCGKQSLDQVTDQAMLQRLTTQAANPDFNVQEGSFSGSMTPVRAPKKWLEAIQKIADGE